MDDVLVIGAGPAGNQAALGLAKRGHTVTVVDRRHVIGEKLCSGIVGAECLREFPAAESQIYRPASAAEVNSPSAARLRLERDEPQAYILNRVSYVASFADQARESGASYLLGHMVRSLQVEEDCVRAVVQNGAGPELVEARCAVVASGFGSNLTRLAGLSQVRDYAIGTQAVVKAPKVKEIEVFLDREIAPGFFAWLVPTTEDNALVGLLSRSRDCDLLNRLLHTLVEEGRIERVVSGPERWGVPMGALPRVSRSRVLVVGDAAGQVKPMTGGGIYYGLLAGRVAAETLDQALVADDLSDSFLSLYEKECHKLFGEEMQVGYTARSLFELLGNKHLNYVVKKLSDNRLARGLLESPSLNFDWHSKPITALLRIPFMTSLLRLVGAGARTLASNR